jgi:hypothetical protein
MEEREKVIDAETMALISDHVTTPTYKYPALARLGSLSTPTTRCIRVK